MSYRIVYGQDPAAIRRYGMRPGRLIAYTAVCFGLFYILTAAFWPEGKEALQELLLPGDAQVTARALNGLVEDLRAGEAVGDAVVVFCREIIADAQGSD